jgi:cysteinyl-tRNA synthetase
VLSFEDEAPPADLETLIKQREEARRSGDFAREDQLRAQLLEKGIAVEDTRRGTVWKRRQTS